MSTQDTVDAPLKRRQKHSIFIFVAISVISIGSTLWEKIHVPKPLNQHILSRYHERMEKVKPLIDEGATVGYVTDDIFGGTGSAAEHSFKYMATRYSLAPILVADSINYKIIIGDFHKPFQLNDLLNRNFKINRSFGQGLLILESTKYDD